MSSQRLCHSIFSRLHKSTSFIQNQYSRRYHILRSTTTNPFSVDSYPSVRYIHDRKRSRLDFADSYRRLNDSIMTDEDFDRRPSRRISRTPGYVEEAMWLRGSEKDSSYQNDILERSPKLSHSSEKKVSWSNLFDVPVKLGGVKHKNGYTPNLIDKLRDIPNLDPRLLNNLDHYEWEVPSAIQRYALPILLDKLDVIGAAQTGSGKTLAFLLPLLQSIISRYPAKSMNALKASGYSIQYPLGLILAPTQELAQQIHLEACKLSRGTCASPVAFFGGQNINIQLSALDSSGCHIAVATPGRFKDMLDRGYLSLEFCRYLVLDEADRMLDMGFEPQIRGILQNPQYKMPDIKERQTSLFSATFTDEVRKLALDHVNREETVMIVVGEDGPMAKNIKLSFKYGLNKREMHLKFLDFIQKIKGDRVLVFCNTRREVDLVDRTLYNKGIQSVGIHGDKSRNIRDRAMSLFKNGKANVLVATDVASRGLDIPNVKHVILYELPRDIADFIHRAGRTGRMGSDGHCITFCDIQNVDRTQVNNLISMLDSMNVEIPPELSELTEIR